MLRSLSLKPTGLAPAIALAALVSLSACSTHPEIQPALQQIDTGRLGVQGVEPAPVAADQSAWWDAYGDARLSGLIRQALDGNPNMQAAAARLQRVAAQERIVRGADMPQLQASAEVNRQRYTEHGIIPPPLAGAVANTGTLQLAGSWELDLFGKQHAQIAASIGQTRASEADVQAARVLLSSQVARSYVALGRLQAQVAVLQRTLGQRDDILKLIRQRVQAGLDTTVELRQGEGALPDTRLQIEALREQVMLTRHALAVLTGQAPDALDTLEVQLEGLQVPALPSTVPLDLLSRRADVMAARWRVEASHHDIDAARANFYPNIDLAAYAGYNAIGLERVLKPGSWQWGLLPAIHLPLFDGDRRIANLQGRVAEQDISVASYNQTVLQAVQETADQLGSLQAIARQQTEQRAAQGHTEAAYALATERYRAGLGNYLNVLAAETAVLNQRRQAVDLQARTLDAQFGLVRALGGAVQPTALPAAATSSSTQKLSQKSGDPA
ncbi:MAG: efflux transporter outer membrane subunit [Proteobacteria bacterium]|uniref:efflux transporter outer membrane subunit n=1 Tax=Aquabacterium sp. TaxID=1872578 RepID=UPI0035C74B9E|nr:efflux transporter outer membrane subunit [Pseudomonadota bacterium]